MIKRLRLQHFKGFNDFTVSFGDGAVLVGPNNAGKSTIIGALRLCSAAARTARRVRAATGYQDGDRSVVGHPLHTATRSGFVRENLRHEFLDYETRLDVSFDTQAMLHVVWPAPDEGAADEAFFWIEYPKGMQVTAASKAKTLLPEIGIVPMLTPIEYSEKELGDEHIRENLETRLTSRHFRNQLAWILRSARDEFPSLLGYLLDWTPELRTLELRESYSAGDKWLDLYFMERGGRTEKELYWAGDGLQIWLQVLFHVWRNRDVATLVLDEPDVFLHPDLQRRLVRVLEETGQQHIIATHAPEMTSEADQRTLIWVDRKRTRSRRITDDRLLDSLTTELGTAMNLSVARALRSRVALFVEGQDMKLLRQLARTCGGSKFAEERGLAVMPIGGFSHWPSVEAFAWLKSQFLGASVDVRLLLDRDYRSDATCADIETRMRDAGVTTHVWRRKELESYLLEVPAIARLTSMSSESTAELLMEVTDELADKVASQFIKVRLDSRDRSSDATEVMESALQEFRALWSDLGSRLARVPAKDAISSLNARLQGRGIPTLSARKLSSGIRAGELSEEVLNLIIDIETTLSAD